MSEPMLFGGPACAVCGAELAWAGKGRRPKYCSKKCSSKADRAREKEKQTQALTMAAETPRGETGLPAGLADDPVAAELLALGAELHGYDRLLLLQLDRAARDDEPALACQAVNDSLHAAHLVMQRHRDLAERLLAEHPTQTQETGQPAPKTAETPRGETAPATEPAEPAPTTPRGETPAPADGAGLRDLVDRHLSQQSAHAPKPAAPDRTVTVPRDPLLRGLPRSMDAHIPLDPAVFGHGWALAGWTVKPDVLLVLGQGHPIGWVERGLSGMGDGWVAVCENYFIGDPATLEARLHDTPELAAHTVHLAYSQNL
ncbi:hypothetical protein PUR61_05315 [Streptomyces sp. BE20]|uniref:hypothetical protein n=1 Tax=Streptomyces sp. BE20 TaxID=3002525 RepID=UPI002E7A9598|nr:hypothetical protein [Streptomyces sp. BE20]MEE1821617.1 hypothetical protein [Streptomyces sp. BE20]